MNTTNVKFHGVQQAYFTAGPQPTLFMGGVGSGKTYIGILKLLKLLDEYPGSRGAIIRQRFSQLKKTTAATLRQLLPKEKIARRNDNEGYIQLTNGSEIFMIHLDKTDSIDNLKSFELNFAYVDQMEDVSEEAWDTLLERLGRWTGAIKRGGFPSDWPFKTESGLLIPPPYAFASAYSPGYDHWITERWWKKGKQREKYRKQGYVVYIGSTRENPNLTKQYVDGRLAMGKEYVERFVDAESWGANEGRIFQIHPDSEVPYNLEIVDRIKRTMRLHRSMDPADFDVTACIWYGTDTHGNLFVYREYGKANTLVSDHRRAIYELSKEDSFDSTPPMYHSNIADPYIEKKTRGRTATSGNKWSVQDEWADRKIMDPETAVFWRAANNDESMTISRLREYLRFDPKHRNPITKQMGSPRIFFILKSYHHPHGCSEVITDIIAARRKEVGMNSDGSKQYGDERDDTVRDHWLDCVRYAVGSRPAIKPEDDKPELEPGHIRLSDYFEMAKEVEYQEELYDKQNFPGHHPYGQ